jgi:hypothetical protein
MTDWMLLLLPLLAVPIVLLFRFIGCGELLSVTPTESFDFSVAANPAEVTVTQGGTTTAQITVTPVGGYNNDVKLTAAPLAGVMLSFSPDTVNPKNGAVASTLTVTPSQTAAVGKSGATIEGKGPGAPAATGAPPNPEVSRTIAFTVNTLAAVPVVADFSLSLSPASRTVPAGTDAIFNVSINRVGGFSEAVDLATVPAGGIFNPDPAPGASSTLRARTTGIPAGNYPFSVTGTGTTGTTRTTSGTVVVT